MKEIRKMRLLPQRNNIVFEKKLSEGRLNQHQEMVLRSEIIRDLFMSKFITLDQCLNLTLQEYSIVIEPAIYELIVYRILSFSMAIKLTSEQINILSFSRVLELILRNHLELVKALNITIETAELLDRLPEKVIDLIYANILNGEQLSNLTENAAFRLQSNNINELIRLEVITVDFALSLSDFHYHLLNLNNYFELIKDNILPPDIFIKLNDLNKKNIYLLNMSEIREEVYAGALTILQIIELSPEEFKKLSSASTRALLKQDLLSAAQIMSLKEWQSSEEISELLNHDFSVSQVLELSREQFIYFTSDSIRRLLDLKLISKEQVLVLKKSQFERLQNVSFFNLIIKEIYSVTEILSLSATQAHALVQDPSLDLVALRNYYKIKKDYVPTVGMGDLGAIEIAKKLVSDDCPDGAIDLKYQNITNIGAKKIAEAIMKNKCRKSLIIDLSFNRIDHEGFDFLVESMKRNTLIIELIVKNQFSQYVNSESKKRSLVHPNLHQVKTLQGCCLRNKLLFKNQGLEFYINKTSKRMGLFKGREANDFPKLEELAMATLMLDENYDGVANNMMLPEEISNAMGKLPSIRNALIPEEDPNILVTPRKISNISVPGKFEDEGCSFHSDKKNNSLFFKKEIEDFNSNSEAEAVLRRAVIKAKSQNIALYVRLDHSAKKAIEYINKTAPTLLYLESLPNTFGLQLEDGDNEISCKFFEEKVQVFNSFMYGDESNRTIDNAKFLLELLSLLEWETEFQETICGVYLILLLPNSEERQNLLLNCLHGSMDISGLSLKASIGVEKVIMTSELEALIDEYLNNYKLISELNECKDLENDIFDKSNSSECSNEDFSQNDEQNTDNDFDFESEEDDDDARAELFKDEIYSISPVSNICKPKRSEIEILEAFKSKLSNINPTLFHKIIPLTDIYYNFHDFLQFLKERLGTSLVTTYDLLLHNFFEYKYFTSINTVQPYIDLCELYDLINNATAHKTYNDFCEETQILIIDKLKAMEDSIYKEITIESAKDSNKDKLLSYAHLRNFSLLKFAEKDWEAVCNIMCSSLSISQKHRLLTQEYVQISLCSFNKILNQHKFNSLFVQRKEWIEHSATFLRGCP